MNNFNFTSWLGYSTGLYTGYNKRKDTLTEKIWFLW